MRSSAGRRPARGAPALTGDFHSVVGGGDVQRAARARDLLERRVSASTRVDRRVVVHRLVVEQAQMARAGHLAQLDADDVARVAPVGLDRDRVGERVHRVENDEVGIAEELDEALGVARVGERVLGIGRVDDDPALRLEAVAVGVAGVALEHRA